MYVARVPNRNSPPAILLREAFREHGKVKNRTLANLSHWPPAQIEALRQVLKGNTALGSNLADAFAIVRSLPHGHVAAVLAMIAQLEIEQLLERGPQRARTLALIAQRVLEPGSKLATARALRADTAHSTLSQELGVTTVDEDDLYETLDWLLPQQGAIEAALARRHLGEGVKYHPKFPPPYHLKFPPPGCSLVRLRGARGGSSLGSSPLRRVNHFFARDNHFCRLSPG